MMAFTRSLLLVVALAASAVKSAPTKLQDRQAPAGVPDYILKYGMSRLDSCLSPCSRTSIVLESDTSLSTSQLYEYF
jgi:hypothetical protein